MNKYYVAIQPYIKWRALHKDDDKAQLYAEMTRLLWIARDKGVCRPSWLFSYLLIVVHDELCRHYVRQYIEYDILVDHAMYLWDYMCSAPMMKHDDTYIVRKYRVDLAKIIAIIEMRNLGIRNDPKGVPILAPDTRYVKTMWWLMNYGRVKKPVVVLSERHYDPFNLDIHTARSIRYPVCQYSDSIESTTDPDNIMYSMTCYQLVYLMRIVIALLKQVIAHMIEHSTYYE
jgi:hypothetical protein